MSESGLAKDLSLLCSKVGTVLWFVAMSTLPCIACWLAAREATGLWANMKAERAFDDRFSRIEIGMTDQKVISQFGEPDAILTKDPVIQYHGNPINYRKPIPNPNKAFWYDGSLDHAACIVFDEEDRVTYVNVGGT